MPLSKTEVEKFRVRLEEMKSQLTQALQIATAAVKKPDEATGYSQHQADQGTDAFDSRINLEVTSHEFQLLRKIENALERIGEGTYGVCVISGQEIPKKRLDAMPYADTTVQAQEKLEKGPI